MPQYKLRPVTVKAISVQDIIDDQAQTPTSHSPRIQGHIDSGAITFQPNSTISIKTVKGKEIGAVGDTLIEDMVGVLSLMKTTEFNALYQPN